MELEEKLTIYLNHDLVAALKELALENGMTVDDVIGKLLAHTLYQATDLSGIAARQSNGSRED